MIFAEMYGRLGNQLFRYATARWLQQTYYPEEQLVLSFQQGQKAGVEDPSWLDNLKFFRTAPYQTYHKSGKLIFNESDLRQKLLAARYYYHLRSYSPLQMQEQFNCQQRYADQLNKQGLYWFRTGYIPLTKSLRKDKFVSGNFESPNYFNSIKETLQQEFQPLEPLLEGNHPFYQTITDRNSVCVTIRRGDFLNQENAPLHYVATPEYFQQAIKIMQERLENPVFCFFSDDIAWVRDNLPTEGLTAYYESGHDPVWEKLRLMSSCKHFILSNSSFSWWAQYLSREPEKLVISPNRWWNNSFQSDLIDPSWIQLSRY